LSDLFSISISALQAFQTAISVTGNNIANANTPGYAEESVNLATAIPQTNGGQYIGSGVDVASISRAVDNLNNSQLNTSTSTLGQLNSLQTYTSQLDNIIGTTAGGLTTALQNYYNGWSTVANDPTSTAARQALIGQAQSVASSFQTTNTQLQALNGNINSGITSDVSQINSIAGSISTLNNQIVTAQADGQTPNELLDQRDAALTSLSKLVGVTTSSESNGALNVFVGNGQPLVLQSTVTQLTTVANPFNATQLEVASGDDLSHPISSQLTSGDLGGLLAARTQAVDPAINQVGRLAIALASSANAQQNAGLDQTGQLGADIFSVAGPVATASANNAGNATASVSVANVGALTSDNYVLSYTGSGYSLTDSSTGAAVALTGSGTAASPLTAAGLSIVLSGTPATGDQFLVQPTAQAAGSFSVALTNPSQIAAAGAVETSAAVANTGSATISAATVQNPANPALLNTTTIQFTSSTTYSVNGAGSFAYSSGGNIAQNGWQVQISGTPAVGDVFTVQSNAGNTGDNTNALASANLATAGVLSGGTTSVNGATSALVTAIGSQAQQVNTAQTAQTAVNSQALSAVQSVSGVNLDEEAANLLQWQQAYQASAQALAIGNQTFSTFMDSINGTYS
jgi:flagellar hook-associated protein 1 FlgK